ncbi:MAG: hypothetical protein V1726_04880 [Methanobacteriota archaeon]
MVELKKTEVFRNILNTMISISGRKTTKGDAISTMDTMLKDLEERYSFLKHIQILDTRFSESAEIVHVLSEINDVEPDDLGDAIQEIVTRMTQSLGKNAGYYYIKELQKRLGDEYNSFIKEMGVDLGLMQLENETFKFRE